MENAGNTPQPLRGVRILDLSKVLAGPLCTQYLADLGAEVIKVESIAGGDDTRSWPPFEDGEGTIFLSVNRNKRSVALDLKSHAGMALCRELLARSDVLIESFAPGVAERLGLGYEAVRAVRDNIIYCSISGYGSQGPMSQDKGYDLIAQAFSGMISVTGEPDGAPVRSPFSPVDQGTGMNAAIGILSALLERGQSGHGMRIEAALFDTALGFLGYFLQGFWQRGTEPVRVGSGHESLCPYRAFDTADLPLILGVANDRLWQTFCEVAEAPDLAASTHLRTSADRVAHRAECEARVAEIMQRRPRAEWMERFSACGIPCSPVHNLGEISAHPHTAASGMLHCYTHGNGRELQAVATPLRLDGQRLDLRKAPPRLGEDTAAVLRELGHSDEAIAAWRRDGVIGTGPDQAATS